ncbi:uncharacterized protein E0L32_001652 [Thyridium curvatum]|uniref:N-acetyltransferase domain-containing protein n=1 Tax=Thyridium curvatum TaxID=1093900 RepID=A0A507AIS3_9PEZI|nr:uncharacterized protein E0L32_001546 [Thyridium curvatum]XP_030990903.1 uncharacterized protein E0L32_001652 [Thyridium curvatum]TPX09086.1 hypothetical protein E0L32_001546 [Thyridium curvatum]TPX09192.1 hypothetical protein E0L32_001652 [Thyridium curvatum]
MALRIAPVKLADLDTFISEAATAPTPGDDLVAPPNPLAWPVTTSAEAEQRARRCFALQRRRVLEDPTTRFMKVVDDDTGATVAVARWHYYPDGYAYASEAAWEMAPLMSTNDDDDDDEAYPPPNFNVRLHNHILTERDSFRESWIPLGEPCWILMHLVTRPSQRRRGAAGMLVRWGMDRARETGAPAYLEAGVQGMPVYEKFGFVPVGDVRRVSLEGLGEVPGGLKEFVLVNMKWDPRVDGKGDE